jgi:hypothetical protein
MLFSLLNPLTIDLIEIENELKELPSPSYTPSQILYLIRALRNSMNDKIKKYNYSVLRLNTKDLTHTSIKYNLNQIETSLFYINANYNSLRQLLHTHNLKYLANM